MGKILQDCLRSCVAFLVLPYHTRRGDYVWYARRTRCGSERKWIV